MTVFRIKHYQEICFSHKKKKKKKHCTSNHRTPSPTWSMEDRTLLTFVLFSASGKALYKNSALSLLLIRLEGIMSFSKCQSILGQKLRDEILPFSMTMTPKHTSESTKEWIYQNKIRILEWSSLSLGLNSIQHLWSWLRRVLNKEVLVQL